MLTCVDLSIDAMDVSGEQQFDVMHNIVKQRLSPDGSVVQEKELESKQFELCVSFSLHPSSSFSCVALCVCPFVSECVHIY